MQKRVLFAMAVGLVLAWAPASRAAVSAEHVNVGCIVAEKFPIINACFNPAAELARARVYFKAEGTVHWYFVEMASAMPCHKGTLPKPKKSMAGKKINYYIEAVDKNFEETRTPEAGPEIVPNEQACKKDTPIAPFASKASVVVGSTGGVPVVPFGFTAAGVVGGGGVGTGLIVAGVAAAGAGAAGIAAATNDNGGTTTTTQSGTLPPTTPPTTPPPTQPPITQPPPTATPTTLGCRPAFSVIPDPPAGTDPLEVTFDMCATVGGARRFTYDFDGNGTVDLRGNTCSATRTYTLTSAGGLAAPSTVTPPSVTWTAVVTAGCAAQGVVESQTYSITVTKGQIAVTPVNRAQGVRRLAWVSQLESAGARGQVVANGATALYVGAGRAVGAAPGRKGENRIEAQLVQGGAAGTWRFELSPTASFEPGSLRVVAGEVAALTADTIVFRLSGKAGERVVFSFRTAD